MSRPRLHHALIELFEKKDAHSLHQVLTHRDFALFMEGHKIDMPMASLVQAFTHTSFTHEFQAPHQEQLEFLGDSVLQLILTHELYQRYPLEKEGRLSKLRSAVVNEKTLAQLARALDLQDLIIVGKGEFTKGLPAQDNVLADTVEALLGQIYLQRGPDFTRALFLGWLKDYIPEALTFEFIQDFDAKSKLQELSLAKYKKLPRYSAEAVGDKFEVKLWINDIEVLTGIYPSKKTGEKELAAQALKKDI